MGNSNPQTREAMSRLALSCSALARAGQVLSMVTDPAKTDEALGQAATILESDAKGSRLPQMESVALECQSALSAVAEGERVAVCRKLATRLARLASTLATEVQEQSRKAGKVEAKPAVSVPSTPAAAPARDPAPQPALTAPPKPVPAVKAVSDKRPSKPKVDLTPIRVAASAEEQAAVTTALELGQRFAGVRNGTLIDTQMDLMWAAKVVPSGSHSLAEANASQCRLGGYADWRLPRPEELHHFLAGGGRDLGPTMFGSGGGAAVALWTSETRRRWFFLRRATAVNVKTASVDVVSARRADVHLLLVRTAPGRR